MRPYYLRQNCCGYYVVSFTNKETGTRTYCRAPLLKSYSDLICSSNNSFA